MYKTIIMFFFYTFYIYIYMKKTQKINRSVVSLFSAGSVLKFISAVCFFLGLFFTFLGHRVSRIEKMFPIFFMGTVIGYAMQGMYIRHCFFFIIFPILLVIKLYIKEKNNTIFFTPQKFNKKK